MNVCLIVFLCLQIVNFQLIYAVRIHPFQESSDSYQKESYLDIDNFTCIKDSCDFLGLDRQIFKDLAHEVSEHFDSRQEHYNTLDSDEEYGEASFHLDKIDRFLSAAEQLIINEFIDNQFYRDEFCADIADKIDTVQSIETTKNPVVRYLLDRKDILWFKPVLTSFINSYNHVFLIDLITRQRNFPVKKKSMLGCFYAENLDDVTDILVDNVSLLIDCGIDVNQTAVQGARYIDERRQYIYGNLGGTALHYAAMYNAVEVCQLLLDKGVKRGLDLYAESNTGYQAIDIAIKYPYIFSLFLDAYGYNVNNKNSLGVPLIARLFCRKPFLNFVPSQILDMMIEKGVDLAGRDRLGNSILENASRNGDTESVIALVARMNPQTIATSFPLHKSFLVTGYKRYCEIASLCLATGLVDINAQDNNGNTPLNNLAINGCQSSMIAFYTQHYRLIDTAEWKKIEFLLKHGADVSITNNLGDTPLHSYAKERLVQYSPTYRVDDYEHRKIVSLFVKAGVDKAARNHSDMYAVDYVHDGYSDVKILMRP